MLLDEIIAIYVWLRGSGLKIEIYVGIEVYFRGLGQPLGLKFYFFYVEIEVYFRGEGSIRTAVRL